MHSSSFRNRILASIFFFDKGLWEAIAESDSWWELQTSSWERAVGFKIPQGKWNPV